MSEGYEVTSELTGYIIIKKVVIIYDIMPSNHTTIGSWVNSKMSGRNPLYCTFELITMQGHQNATIIKGTISLGYSPICYIWSKIG